MFDAISDKHHYFTHCKSSKVIAADLADMAKHLMVDRSEQEEVRGAR